MRGTKKSQCTEVDDRAIYIMMSPVSKEFFCGHCTLRILRNLYRQHMCEHYTKTSEWIQELKRNDLHPCLFVLEEVRCSKVEAYNYVVVWTKIFSDAGYTSLQQGNVMDYMQDLTAGNQTLYEQRKSIDLKELLRCKNCRVQTYNKVKCSHCKEDSYGHKDEIKPKEYYIKFRVTEEQDQQIRRNAKAAGKTLSSFCRDVTCNVAMIDFDQDVELQRTETIRSLYNNVRHLFYQIKRDDQYTPADLEFILKVMKEIMRTENNVLKERREIKEKIRRETARVIRGKIGNQKNGKGNTSL